MNIAPLLLTRALVAGTAGVFNVEFCTGLELQPRTYPPAPRTFVPIPAHLIPIPAPSPHI